MSDEQQEFGEIAKKQRYSVARLRGNKPSKPTSMQKPEKYTVPRSMWCKKIKWDGSECHAPKVAGKDGCVHHNSKDGGKHVEAVQGDAADKFQLPDTELNTIQDVIVFLGKLINCYKNGGVEKHVADTLARLTKELVGAIKERDGNSPEAAQKKKEEIMAIVVAARQLGADAAREVLLSRNFELLEMRADAQPQEDVVNVDVVQLEAGLRGAKGQAADEAGQAEGSA